jgi:hypothetical protein
LETKIDNLTKMIGELMTDQEHLDSDAAAILTALQSIVAEIAALKAQPAAAALDFTNLDAAVASVQSTPDAPVTPPDVPPTP